MFGVRRNSTWQEKEKVKLSDYQGGSARGRCVRARRGNWTARVPPPSRVISRWTRFSFADG
jgi:hypothetical protein